MFVCLFAHVVNVASEEKNPVKFERFLVQWGQNVEKHGKICIRRGKSCDNPTVFVRVEPKMWDVGKFASVDGKSCEKPKDIFGAVGPKIMKKRRKSCIRRGKGFWYSRAKQVWCNPWEILHQKRKP